MPKIFHYPLGKFAVTTLEALVMGVCSSKNEEKMAVHRWSFFSVNGDLKFIQFGLSSPHYLDNSLNLRSYLSLTTRSPVLQFSHYPSKFLEAPTWRRPNQEALILIMIMTPTHTIHKTKGPAGARAAPSTSFITL